MANASKKLGLGCGVLFMVPFVLVGLGVFVGMGLWPLWQSWSSARWIETPCIIEDAKLITSRDSDGDSTAKVEVVYTYTVRGQEYRSERYSFQSGSTNIGMDAMSAAVSRLRRESKQRCWVDPSDASSAVLERNTPSSAWFGLVFGAMFAGFPLLILVVMFKGWRKDKRREALGDKMPVSDDAKDVATLAASAAPSVGSGGPVKLESADRRGCGAAFLVLFALIWNGVVWFMFLSASGDWFARIFLLIFIAVGAGVALLAIHQVLSLFTPQPELELERDGLRPGEGAELRWVWQGNHRRITNLEIALIGREEASYTRGTDTVTDKHELSSTVLYEGMEPDAEGRVRLRIPAEALPTLTARNNKVKWLVRVKGSIPRFPDVNREFSLTVLPPANGVIDSEATAPADGAIILAGGRAAVRPGDAVHGRIRWSLAETRTKLELRLFWHTAGKGTVDAVVVDRLVVDEPGASGDREFSLRIPATGPVSCSGTLVSVLWALELVGEPGGALGKVDLVVGPTGRELRASS